MKKYMAPQNLRASANLWLWSLRDFTVLIVSALLSILILSQSGVLLPLAFSFVFGVLSIRFDDLTVLDYIRFASRYLFTSQQYFTWKLEGGRRT